MQRLRIENLPPDISIADIDDLIRPFGETLTIELKTHAKPLIAYVQFVNERIALQAAEATNGYNYKGYTLKVKLVKANDKARDIKKVTPAEAADKFKNSKQKNETKIGENTKATNRWDRDKKGKRISDLGSQTASSCDKPKSSRWGGYVFDNVKVIDPKNKGILIKPTLPPPILTTCPIILPPQNVLNTTHSSTITTTSTINQDVVIIPPANVIEANDNLHRKQFPQALINVVTQLRQKLAYSQTTDSTITWDFGNFNQELAEQENNENDRFQEEEPVNEPENFKPDFIDNKMYALRNKLATLQTPTQNFTDSWNFSQNFQKNISNSDDANLLYENHLQPEFIESQTNNLEQKILKILNQEILTPHANDLQDIRYLNGSPYSDGNFQQSYSQLLNSNQYNTEVMEHQKNALQKKLLKYLNEEETSQSSKNLLGDMRNFDFNISQHSEEDIQKICTNLFDSALTFSSHNEDNLMENQKLALQRKLLKFLTEETSTTNSPASRSPTNSRDTRNFDFSQHFKKDFQQNASTLSKNIFDVMNFQEKEFLENPIVRQQLLALKSKTSSPQHMGNPNFTFSREQRSFNYAEQQDIEQIELSSSENSCEQQELFKTNRNSMKNQKISRDNLNFNGKICSLTDNKKKTINNPNDFTQLRQKLLSLQTKPTISTTGFKEQFKEGFKQNDIILLDSNSSCSENSKDTDCLKSYNRNNDFNNIGEIQNPTWSNQNFNISTQSKFNLSDLNITNVENFVSTQDYMNNYKIRNDFDSIKQSLKTSKQTNIDGTNRFNDQNFKTSTKSNIECRNLSNDLNEVPQKFASAQSALTSEIFQHFQGSTSSRDGQNNRKRNFDKDFEEIELLNRLSKNGEYNEPQGQMTSRDSRNTKEFQKLKLLSSISSNQSKIFMGNESETLHQLKNNRISNKHLDYQDFQGLNSSKNNKNLNFDKDLEELELLSSRNKSYVENEPVTTRNKEIVESRHYQLKSDRNTNKNQDNHDFQGPTASRNSRNTKEFEDLELLSFRSRNPSKNFQRNESVATRVGDIDEAMRQQLKSNRISNKNEDYHDFQGATSSRDSQSNKKRNFDKDFDKDFEELDFLSPRSRNQISNSMGNESVRTRDNDSQGLNSFRNNKQLNFDKDLEEIELLSSRSRNPNANYKGNESKTTRDNDLNEAMRHQLKNNKNSNKNVDYLDFQGITSFRYIRNAKNFEELELLSSRSRNPNANYKGNESKTTRDNDLDEAMRDQLKSNKDSNKNEDYLDFQGPISSRYSRNAKDFEELELLSSQSRNPNANYKGNELETTRDNGLDKAMKHQLKSNKNSNKNEDYLDFQGPTSSRYGGNTKDFKEMELFRSQSRSQNKNYVGNESVKRDSDIDEAMQHQLKSNRISNKNENYHDSQEPNSSRYSRNTKNFEELEMLSSRSRNPNANYKRNESETTRDNDLDEAMRHQLKSNRISNKNENYHDSQGPNSSRYSQNANDFEDLEMFSSRSRNPSKNYIENMSRDDEEAGHQQLKRQRISNTNEDYCDSQGANSRNSRNNKITNFNSDFNELELLSSTSRNREESVTSRESEINCSDPLAKVRQKLLSLNAPALSQQSSITNDPATSMNKSYTNDSEQTQWNGEIYQQKELSNYQGNNQTETKISSQSSNCHNNSSNALMQLRQKLASIRTEARSTHSCSSNQNFTNSSNTRNFDNSVYEYLQQIKTAVDQQNDFNLAGPSLTQQKQHPADLYPNNLNIQRKERGYWEKELNRSCSSSTSDDSYAPESKTTKRTQEDIFDNDFVTDNKNYNLEDSSSKTLSANQRSQVKKPLKIKQPWFDREMMEARKKARRLFNQAKEKGNWDDYKEAMRRFKYMTRKAKRSAEQNSEQAESDYTNR